MTDVDRLAVIRRTPGRDLLDFIRERHAWFGGGRMIEPYESQAVEKLDGWLAEHHRGAVEALREIDRRADEPGFSAYSARNIARRGIGGQS